MSYTYKSKPKGEFVKIAEKIRDLFPHQVCSQGFRFEIEGLIDDFDIRILPRHLPKQLKVEAYVARDPKIIVIQEYSHMNPRRKRFTLAEEMSHKILEYNLWENKTLPVGSGAHEVDRKTYRLIEKDAKALAAELLMPEVIFSQNFLLHRRRLIAEATKNGGNPPATPWLLTTIRILLAGEFDVSIQATGRRMSDLKLITPKEYRAWAPLL